MEGAEEIINCLMPNVNIQPEIQGPVRERALGLLETQRDQVLRDKSLQVKAELTLLKEIIVQAVAKAYKP